MKMNLEKKKVFSAVAKIVGIVASRLSHPFSNWKCLGLEELWVANKRQKFLKKSSTVI